MWNTAKKTVVIFSISLIICCLVFSRLFSEEENKNLYNNYKLPEVYLHQCRCYAICFHVIDPTENLSKVFPPFRNSPSRMCIFLKSVYFGPFADNNWIQILRFPLKWINLISNYAKISPNCTSSSKFGLNWRLLYSWVQSKFVNLEMTQCQNFVISPPSC